MVYSLEHVILTAIKGYIDRRNDKRTRGILLLARFRADEMSLQERTAAANRLRKRLRKLAAVKRALMKPTRPGGWSSENEHILDCEHLLQGVIALLQQ